MYLGRQVSFPRGAMVRPVTHISSRSMRCLFATILRSPRVLRVNLLTGDRQDREKHGLKGIGGYPPQNLNLRNELAGFNLVAGKYLHFQEPHQCRRTYEPRELHKGMSVLERQSMDDCLTYGTRVIEK